MLDRSRIEQWAHLLSRFSWKSSLPGPPAVTESDLIIFTPGNDV